MQQHQSFLTFCPEQHSRLLYQFQLPPFFHFFCSFFHMVPSGKRKAQRGSHHPRIDRLRAGLAAAVRRKDDIFSTEIIFDSSIIVQPRLYSTRSQQFVLKHFFRRIGREQSHNFTSFSGNTTNMGHRCSSFCHYQSQLMAQLISTVRSTCASCMCPCLAILTGWPCCHDQVHL